MGNESDVFKWRRYGHWESAAAKARLAAFVLWQMGRDSRLGEMASECRHHGGDAELAVSEAFKRESSLALELVVKAVIARKRPERAADPATEGIPATHDLPKLWKDAGLPDLPHEDVYRLHLAKSVLVWSGRYPTPLNEERWAEELKAFHALEDPPAQPGEFVFRRTISLGWIEFDELYQRAHQSFR